MNKYKILPYLVPSELLLSPAVCCYDVREVNLGKQVDVDKFSIGREFHKEKYEVAHETK